MPLPDEPKPALPTLLPWAATACLAALLACVGELWAIGKARTRLMHDQSMLAEAALRGAENQLEAERILERREREEYAASEGALPEPRVVLLAPVGQAPSGPAPSGAVVVDLGRHACLLAASGMPLESPDRDFQLWLLGPGPGYPADCGTFHSFPQGDPCVRLRLAQPVGPGCRFVLIYGVRGGAGTYRDAASNGVMELASRLPPGKMPY
jgi:hypothetical protein